MCRRRWHVTGCGARIPPIVSSGIRSCAFVGMGTVSGPTRFARIGPVDAAAAGRGDSWGARPSRRRGGGSRRPAHLRARLRSPRVLSHGQGGSGSGEPDRAAVRTSTHRDPVRRSRCWSARSPRSRSTCPSPLHCARAWFDTTASLPGSMARRSMPSRPRPPLRRAACPRCAPCSSRRARPSTSAISPVRRSRVPWTSMACSARPSATIIEVLTAQRGLGRWTADWFLARCLGRGDVCPAGDLAVRKAFAASHAARSGAQRACDPPPRPGVGPAPDCGRALPAGWPAARHDPRREGPHEQEGAAARCSGSPIPTCPRTSIWWAATRWA